MKIKNTLSLDLPFIILGLLIASTVAMASMIIPLNPQGLEHGQGAVHSPVITENPEGNWGITRVDFIHYANTANQSKSKKSDSCSKLLGARWSQLPAVYTINPTNSNGLLETQITSAILSSFETWDVTTSRELANDLYTTDTSARYGFFDGKNVIDFGSMNEETIGVTSIWINRSMKTIVEFDIRLNSYYQWGDALTNTDLMDLQNILTHESGHAFGLNDIYSGSCAEVTMYGYSNTGEVMKRTLEPADISGIQKLYGL